MSSRLRALAASAGIAVACGVAHAADYPSPVDVLRGSIDEAVVALDEVAWTVEGRFWYSTGHTAWDHDATSMNPNLGNPTSKLEYQKQIGRTGEIEIRGDEATGLFGRATIGIGSIGSGKLRDRDWFSGDVLFSDTMSSVDGGDITYGSVDGGWSIDRLSDGLIQTSVFAGYGFWKEKSQAFGAICSPDDVNNAICPLGENVAGSGINGITNEVEWHMLRIGAEAKLRVGSMLTLSGEAAVIPVAAFYNADSHHLRLDLGRVPNVQHEGTGFGVQAQALATFHLTDQWSVGVGARYWHLENSGNPLIRFGGSGYVRLPVNHFETTRYGVLATSGLRF